MNTAISTDEPHGGGDQPRRNRRKPPPSRNMTLNQRFAEKFKSFHNITVRLDGVTVAGIEDALLKLRVEDDEIANERGHDKEHLVKEDTCGSDDGDGDDDRKKDGKFCEEKSGLTTDQLERPGQLTGRNLHSVKASGIADPLKILHTGIGPNKHGYPKQHLMKNMAAESSGKDTVKKNFGNKKRPDKRSRLASQLDRTGPLTGSNFHSVKASDIEESLLSLHAEIEEIGNEHGYNKQDQICMDNDESADTNEKKKASRSFRKSKVFKDYHKEKVLKPRRKHYIRPDARGMWLLSQDDRNLKNQMIYRGDIDMLNAHFLETYESLIPTKEEKSKQMQLLALLKIIVGKEWPEAELFLYGSCANSFSLPNSDLDVCFKVDDTEICKSDLLLRLAEILQSENFQNVEALTRTRVPIVKLLDPATGISCDLCVNNALSVENSKLLRDYAQIDVRLQQLVLIVKHWAKSRDVNETYVGTLSSYAYALMCVHFLQQHTPAILPCLQAMKTTYSVTVDNFQCAYFDRVEELRSFGSHNKENIAQLVWAFFHYWAYCHDYENTVISVRTGSIISKESKEWATNVGNNNHFLSIEDPFELSHDLGRVINSWTVKVIRVEFERAARIMQDDPNPNVNLFEQYVSSKGPLWHA